MSINIITQARFSSSRLPGKVLKKINDKTLLEIHLERLKKVKGVNDVIVATTTEDEASEIVKIAEKLDCGFLKGSINDVLDRFYEASARYPSTHIIRVTSDCPLIDPEVIDLMIEDYEQSKVHYMSNTIHPTYPDGMDAEIFRYECLDVAQREARDLKEREHVTPYIYNHPEKFILKHFKNNIDYSSYRLTVDTEDDFKVISHLVKNLGDDLSFEEYIKYLDNNPEIKRINSKYMRNEGY